MTNTSESGSETGSSSKHSHLKEEKMVFSPKLEDRGKWGW